MSCPNSRNYNNFYIIIILTNEILSGFIANKDITYYHDIEIASKKYIMVL